MPEPLRCVPDDALIVGWDFSTSAVKALAFTLDGEVAARSWFKNDVWTKFERDPNAPDRFIDTGNREINLMQLEGQARASARDLAAKLNDLGLLNRWLAAGISATHHTAGLIDENGNQVRRAICWDDQTLAKFHSIGLQRLGGAARVRELIGGPWAVRYSLSHLVKDQQTLDVDDWRRARWMMGHGPLAAGHLTGRFGVTSISSAASTGILDLRSDQWQLKMLEALGSQDPAFIGNLGSKLPTVLSTFRPIGPVLEHVSGRSVKPLVFPTLDDQAAGLVGGGATQPGELAIILGTSAVVNSSADAAPTTDALDAMKLGWDDAYLWMRCYSNGAAFVESVAPLTARLEANDAAAKLPPGCNGTAVLPFLNSEPSLGVTEPRVQWRNAADDPAVRVRAAYEAVSYLIALGVRAHRAAGQTITRITVSGGLARSRLMCEILASVLAGELPEPLPLVRLNSQEGSALGAAVLALAGLESTLRSERNVEGRFTIADAVAKLVKTSDEVSHNPDWVQQYRKGLADFEKWLQS